MENFYVGQIFEEMYPPEAAEWCNENGYTINEIDPLNNQRRFEIVIPEAEKPEARADRFKASFFEIPYIENIFDGGWYRRTPKGYSSAIESINTALNAVNIIGSLPADYLTFYKKPNFNKPEECTEEWLVENSFKNKAMTIDEFRLFYTTFLTVWNTQEHQ